MHSHVASISLVPWRWLTAARRRVRQAITRSIAAPARLLPARFPTLQPASLWTAATVESPGRQRVAGSLVPTATVSAAELPVRRHALRTKVLAQPPSETCQPAQLPPRQVGRTAPPLPPPAATLQTAILLSRRRAPATDASTYAAVVYLRPVDTACCTPPKGLVVALLCLVPAWLCVQRIPWVGRLQAPRRDLRRMSRVATRRSLRSLSAPSLW